MTCRAALLLAVVFGLLNLSAAASAQDEEAPAIDRRASPRLPAIPEAIAAQVEELRAVVRRTNRCRDYQGERDMVMGPGDCYGWFDTIDAAPVAVRDHAVGTELVRRLMSPRGRALEVRLFERGWYGVLEIGGEDAARYLVRAGTLLEGATDRYQTLTWLTFRALGRVTWQPVEPIPPWGRRGGAASAEDAARMRDAWLAWYGAHEEEDLATWRRDGLAANRANLEGEDSMRIAYAVDAIWRAEAEDRADVVRAAMLNPHLVGRARRFVHAEAVSRRWGRVLALRESYGLTRRAMAARRELLEARRNP